MIAAAAVVLAIALLVVGGVALWGALTSDPEPPTPGASQADPPAGAAAPSSNRQPQTATQSPAQALVVRCRAARCRVFIAVPPANDVVFNGTLGRGETRTADEARLNLVVGDGSTVDVFINGKLQPKGQPGERAKYSIVKSSD